MVSPLNPEIFYPNPRLRVPFRCWLALLLLAAVSPSFATILSGSADLVLGQADFTSDAPGEGSQFVTNDGVAVDTNTGHVYVADQIGRVVWWNSAAELAADSPPDGVLGVPSLNTIFGELAAPFGIAVDGVGDVWVTDPYNNRVVEYSTPIVSGEFSSLVLGEPDLNTGSGGTTQNLMQFPTGVRLDAAGDIWVADQDNNRVLEFAPPFSDGENAALVLGEPDFMSSGGGATQSLMDLPISVSVDASGNVWVADQGNNRVLGFAPSSTNGAAAAVVLGEPDFTTTTGGTSQTLLNVPNDVAVDGTGDVWVADNANIRVLEFASPVASGAPATLVLGQGSFTSNGWGGGADQLQYPEAMTFDGAGTLWLTDNNSRVMQFSPVFSNGMSAGLIYTGTARAGLDAPDTPAPDPATGRIYVSDFENARVLWWNSRDNLVNGQPADGVLGQPDFTSSAPGKDANHLGYSQVILADKSGNLWAADETNERVLEFAAPVTNGESASLVLGAPDFTTAGGGTSQSSMAEPISVARDAAGDVWVADISGNRVLEYTAPLSDGESAALVLGQSDFNSHGSGTGAAQFNGPRSLVFDPSGNLWVTDANNNRVLGFSPPFHSGANASIVLGQPDLTSNAAGNGANQLHKPGGLSVDSTGDLWVSDRNNSRVQMFPVPLSTNESATMTVGQGPGASASSFYVPFGLGVDSEGDLWAGDLDNSRVLEFLGAPSQVSIPGCASTVLVDASGVRSSTTSIKEGLASLPPSPWTGNQCVLIESGTYSEAVNIQGIDTGGFRLELISYGGVATVVSPPNSGSAAITVAAASVTLSGFSIVPVVPEPYDIEVSSPDFLLQDMVITDPTGNIVDAGVQLDGPSASGITIADSAVTVNASRSAVVHASEASGVSILGSDLVSTDNGDVVHFDGGYGETIQGSTLQTARAPDGVAYFNGTSSSTIQESIIQDAGPGVCNGGQGGDGVVFSGGGGSSVVRSTVTTNGAADGAFYAEDSNNNQILGSYLADAYESQAVLWSNSNFNSIVQSTAMTNSPYACESGYAAIYATNGSSDNTVLRTVALDPGTLSHNNGGGVWFDYGGQGNQVLSSSVSVVDSYAGAVYMDGTGDGVSGSFINDPGGGDGIYVDENSSAESVSGSTVTTIGALQASVDFDGTESSTLSQSYLADTGGRSAVSIYGEGVSTGVVVSSSTLYAFGGQSPTLLVDDASGTYLTDLIILDPSAGDGLEIQDGASFTTLTLSTVTTASALDGAVFVQSSSSNTITQDWIYDPGGYNNNVSGSGDGVSFVAASGNTLSQSTITTYSAENAAVFIQDSASNYLEGDVISDGGGISRGAGDGVELMNADGNVLNGCSVAAFGAQDAALFLSDSSSDTVTGCAVNDPVGDGGGGTGDGILLQSGGGDSIVASSVTTGGAGDAALYAELCANDVVSGDYAADSGGSAAMEFDTTEGSLLAGSVLSGLPPNSGAGSLHLANDNVDFAAVGDVVSAGSSGSGIYVDAGQTDYLDLSSNVVSGAAFGLTFQSLAAPANDLAVSTLTFQSLAPGATAVEFLGGAVSGSTFSFVSFDPSVAAPVDASQLNAGSALYLANASGTGAVQAHDDDPNGFVHFTNIAAPGAVIDLTPSVLGVSSITWSWVSVSGATGYDFYSPPQSPPQFVAANSYTQTNLSTNTAYVAQVAAMNDGVLGPLSPPVTAYTPAVPPFAPVVVTSGPFGVTLVWGSNGNPGYTPYQVQLWTAGGSTTTQVVTSTSASFVPLPQGATYFLQVSALGLNGAYSPAVQVSTYIPPCVYVYQGVETIQSVTSALPSTFTSNLCIQVETGTYTEPIVIPSVNTAGFRLTVRSDGPQAAVLQPPSVTAFIQVEAASVTVQGFAIQPVTTANYGVEIASSDDVVDGLVLVDPGGSVGSAGFYAAPSVVGARLSDSTITVNTGATVIALFDTGSSRGSIVDSVLTNLQYGLDGVVFNGGSGNAVWYSTVATHGAYDGAIFLNGSGGDVLSNLYVSDDDEGCGVQINAGGGNRLQNSTVAVNSAYDGGYAGVLLGNGASSNTLTGLFVYDPDTANPGWGGGVYFDYTPKTGNALSFSTISVNGAYAGDVFFEGNNSSSTVDSCYIADPGGGDGVDLNQGDVYNTISHDIIQTYSAYDAAVFVNQSASNTITQNMIQDLGGTNYNLGDGISLSQAVGNTVSFSSVTTYGANDAALYDYQGSSNVFAGVYATDLGGTVAGGFYQTYSDSVSSSGFAGNGGGGAYTYQSNQSQITGSFFGDTNQGDGLFVYQGGPLLIANSTFSTVDADDAALYLFVIQGSTIADSFIQDAGPGSDNGGNNEAVGLVLNESNGNIIVFSTVSTNGAYPAGLNLVASSYNSMMGDTIEDAAFSDAVYLDPTSDFDAILQSSISADSSFYDDDGTLEIAGGSDTVSDSFIYDPDTLEPGNGNGIFVDGETTSDIIQNSTVAVSGAANGAVYVGSENSSIVVTGSYLSDSNGAGAAYYDDSNSGDVLSSCTLVETGGANPALTVTSNNSGLTLSSDTIGGASIGAQFQDAVPGLAISTLTFQSLAPGATAMQFLDTFSDNPAWDSTFTYVDFADTSVATNVDASQILSGNLLAFADSEGPREGTQFDDDPNGVVVFQQTPGVTGGLQGAALGVSSIAWTWSEMPNTTGYDFYFATGTLLTLTTTYYDQTSLAPNTTYGAQVQALDDGLSGALTPSVTVYTLAEPASGLTLTDAGISTATFTWGGDGNPADTSYRLDFWIVGGSTVTQAVVASTTGTLSGLNGGTTYYVDVQAVNGNGIASARTGAPVKLVTLPIQAAVVTLGTGGGVVAFTPGQNNVIVTIPPGAFTSSVTFTVQAPAADSLPPPHSDAVSNAQNTGVAALVSLSGNVQPSAPVQIELSYSGTDLSAFNANDLVIAQYNPAEGIWVPLPSTVNAAQALVTAYAQAFLGNTNSLSAQDSLRAAGLRPAGATGSAGLFEIMAVGAATSVSDVNIFPNPFRPALGETTVTFSNLPAGASVKIFTLLGEKVRDLSAGTDGIATWDGTNSSGVHVASDVYFVLVDGAGGKKVLKLIVQR